MSYSSDDIQEYNSADSTIRSLRAALASVNEAWQAALIRAGSLETDLAEARSSLTEVEARLPEGMKHCTIQFRECAKGHGWLTATNWVEHGCQICLLAEAERERDGLRAQRAEITIAADRTIMILRGWQDKTAALEADLATTREALEFAINQEDRVAAHPSCGGRGRRQIYENE